MSQMLIASIPGFFDLADSTIAGGQALTDYALAKISHNAKFSAVRCEVIPMGFFGPGDTVPPPVSPVDGYAYSYQECLFCVLCYYSGRRPAPGYTPGQVTPPALANTSTGTGNLIVAPYICDINNANGLVSLQTYWSGNAAQNDGTIKVVALCQRLSVNLPAGVSGD